MSELDPKPVFRVELSIPQARTLLAEFGRNRRIALRRLSEELRSQAQQAVNELLNMEFEVQIGPSRGVSPFKRNGYKCREYALKGVGLLRLKVPRDREGKFESNVIPSYERVDPRIKEDMAILQLAGLSARTLSLASHRLLGLRVGKDMANDSMELIKEESIKWLDRDLSAAECWALLVDGTNFKIRRRDSVEKEPSLVVLGLTGDNYRSILAIDSGWKDNKSAWIEVFKTLKRRGLDGSKIRLGVMDGLPGLEQAFVEEFPNATTQRCWVHAKQNVIQKCPKRLRESLSILLNRVMYAESESNAREAFIELREAMSHDNERAIRMIEKDLDSLLRFFKFDKSLWHALRTTNAIERVNKELKRRVKSMETLSDKSHIPLLAFTALRLEMGWRKFSVDSPQERGFMAVADKRRSNKIEIDLSEDNNPTLNSLEKVVDQLGLVN